MKKRNMLRKLLALGLSLTMLVSLTACQSKEEGGSSQPEQESQVSEQSSEENVASGEAGAPEPITFTIGVTQCEYGNGIHTEKNAFLQKLKEETGVELDFIIYDNDAYSLMAAGGDLPDLLVLNAVTGTTISEMIKSGYLLPLDDLLEEHGQHIKENIPLALEAARRQGDGKVYGMPIHVSMGSDVPQRNGWIGIKGRYDIYKAIGSPEIHSEDEFLNVLKQMVDYERERTGENDIYALSSFSDWGTWPYIICYPFSQGLMNYTGGLAYDRGTGEWVDGYADENSIFWDGIEFFNKAYRMGIFDVDGLTQKQSQYNEKVSTGKLVATIFDDQLDAAICGENAIMTYLPGEGIPVLCGTYTIPYPIGYGLQGGRAISVGCKNPERAMQMFDWIESPEGARCMRNGVQGEDWDYVDGVPQLIGDMLKAYEDNTQADYRRDRTGDPLPWSNLFSGDYTAEDGYSTSLIETQEFIAAHATAAEKAFAQDFDPNLSYPGQVYDKWVKEGNVTDYKDIESSLKVSFRDEISEESRLVISEADNYIISNISKPILAETPEDFEKEKAAIISKIKELDYEKMLEEIDGIFKKSAQVYEETYGK